MSEQRGGTLSEKAGNASKRLGSLCWVLKDEQKFCKERADVEAEKSFVGFVSKD